MALNILEAFFTNTSIHGLTYIVQPSRYWFEKFFWFLWVLISFILTGLLILKLVVESQNNPIVIYTDKNTINIKDVTFPAVTACLGLMYRSPCRSIIDYDLIKKDLEENKEKIKNLTLDQLKLMQVLSLASHDHFMSQNFPSLKIPTDDFMDQLEIFHEMTPPKVYHKKTSYYLMESLWLNRYLLNTVQVLSNCGSCYTYNMPPIEDIYKPESVFYNFSINRVYKFGQMRFWEIYTADFLNSSYPQKARDRDKGLEVQLDIAPFPCIFPNGTSANVGFLKGTALDSLMEGFYINIHSPYEVLSKKDLKFNLDMNERLDLIVTPKITKIDESLMDASLAVRNCYFEGERELKFFKVYNKINCEHECLAQMTLKSCGCVQFFMARNQMTKICGTSDEKCFEKVQDDFDLVKYTCKCYDPCKSLTYEVDLRSRTTNYEKGYIRRPTKMVAFVTFISDTAFVLCKKQSQTAVEFLSFVGGLLGLFAGFSVMTVAEVLYYFIVYPLIEKRKRKITKVHPINLENLKQSSKKLRILKFFKDAVESSSIHTFSQIGGDGKSIIERFSWIILLAFSMTLASYAVRDVYKTYKEHSITFNFEGSPTNVEDIPFPAFTIIRDMEINTEQLFEDNITAFGYDDDYYFTVLDQFRYIFCNQFGYLKDLPFVKFRTKKDLMEALEYHVFYQYPWFKTRNATWNKLLDPPFAETLTSTLKGYTFNLIEQSKLINEDLISDDFYYSYGKNPNFPWKTSAREDMGLRLEVNMSYVYKVYNGDKCLNRDAIIIHPTNALPIGFDQITVSKHDNYLILIAPKIIKADEDLRSLDISIRKCYFEGERKLKFFKVYTQRNCELECHAHVFLKRCGCNTYDQVRSKATNICDYNIAKYCDFRLQNYINYTFYEYLFEREGVCKCLPSCNYIEYSYEINRIGHRINWGTWHKNALFEMKWKDSEYFALIQSQQLKLVDFLAYVGGILGLFAGISVLSIFEVFYFLTLRLVTDLFRCMQNRVIS